MVLSDYDTAAEKISALKAACLDPALANLTTTDFTANTTLWIICSGDLYLNNYRIRLRESYGFNYRIQSGDIIGLNGNAMIYIKDSDIVYSDPITTYQDRLSTILETNVSEFGNGSIITSGANGSLLLLSHWVKLTTGQYISNQDNAIQESSIFIPIPSGTQLTTDSDIYSMCRYFDVPADW